MKLILDLDENTVKNMQGYCEQKKITLNELVETLFNRFVQEPADVFDKIYEKEGDLKKLEEFQELLVEYLNETIIDLEEVSKTDEAYETDLKMLEVFRALNREYIYDARVMSGLLKEFLKEE